MLIDWFTVAAQIINFLVLIALLKYFLYGRILEAMDKREQNILSRFEEAEKSKQEAGQEAEAYRAKNREWEQQRHDMLAQAGEEVETRRQELIREARAEVGRLEARWQQAMQRQQAAFLAELRRRAALATCALSRRALSDLASAELEELVARVFLKRIRTLDETAMEALRRAAEQAGGQMVVRSAFEVPATTRKAIEAALEDGLAPGLQVRFERAPELVCGIELKVHGQRLAWSLDSYLENLEEALGDAFRDQEAGALSAKAD